MLGESHSLGTEAISTKVVTTTASRACGITGSPGTTVVVKKGHNDLLPRTNSVLLFFFF